MNLLNILRDPVTYSYDPQKNITYRSKRRQSVFYLLVVLSISFIIVFLYDIFKDIARFQSGFRQLLERRYDVDMLMKLTGWTRSNAIRGIIQIVLLVIISIVSSFLYEEQEISDESNIQP